jgi:hypothetical protein
MNDKIISLKEEANVVYGIIDKQQVDYDTFKQVADASASMTMQAKKVYDRLYNTFIQYPFFVRSLEGVYLESKEESDKDAKLLQQKLDVINVYKQKYDSIITQISELEIENDIAELAAEVQDLANNPDSLVYSYELVDAADAAARAAVQAEIQENTRTGTEVCIDKDGKIVDMSICRPSSGGGVGSGTAAAYNPSASEIAAKGIDAWIEIVNAAAKKDVKDVIEAAKKSDVIYQEAKAAAEKAEKAEADRIEAERVATLTAAQKAAEEKAAAEKAESDRIEAIAAEKARLEKLESDQKAAVAAAEKAAAEKELKLATELKSITNSFKFNVDLSKITQDKKLLDETAPSLRQQNINYALCSAKKTIVSNGEWVVVGKGINDYRYHSDGMVGTGKIVVYSSVNLKQNQKIKLSISDNIYILATVSSYSDAGFGGGILNYIIEKSVGGKGLYSGFILSIYNQLPDITQYIIQTPVDKLSNGMNFNDWANAINATNDEISIARVYCPTSDYSSDYYKTSNFTNFDGETKSFNLTPALVALSAVSILYIMHNILKKDK